MCGTHMTAVMVWISTGYTNVNLLYLPDGIELAYTSGETLCSSGNQPIEIAIGMAIHDFYSLKTTPFRFEPGSP